MSAFQGGYSKFLAPGAETWSVSAPPANAATSANDDLERVIDIIEKYRPNMAAWKWVNILEEIFGETAEVKRKISEKLLK